MTNRLKRLLQRLSMAGHHNGSMRSMTSVDSYDLMVCDVCLEQYDDQLRIPKFLLCHHTFCESCLKQVASDAENIECPSCRHLTSLHGHGGITGLQTNFYITHMGDMMRRMAIPKVKGCALHSYQPLSFFCEKCSVTVCRDCTVLDHKDSDGHTIQDVNEAETQQREQLNDCILSAKETLSSIQSQIVFLEAEISNLNTAKETVIKDIDTAFQKYWKILEVRKGQLVKEVIEMYTVKQESIIEKSQGLSKVMKDLLDDLKRGETAAKKGQLTDIVIVKNGIKLNNEELKTRTKQFDVGNNFLNFDCKANLQDFQTSVNKLAGVSATGKLPSRVEYNSGKLVACLESEVTITVYSYDGEQLINCPVDVVVMDNTDQPLTSSMVHSDNGEHKITFRPQASGPIKLVTQFLGSPIRGSETKLEVESNDPVRVIGDRGEGEGKFKSPRAIAVDKDGFLYVADTGNRIIQKLKQCGEFVHQFSIDGGNEDCSTCDVALNKERNVIVCTETLVGNTVNPTMGNTVATYSTDGKLKHKFTNKNMKCALCVATNRHGEIIISDYLVHSLFMYDEHGSFIRRIGNSGAFNHPAFITIGEDDNVIVSDTNNDSIQVFDRNGRFLYHFGKSGHAKGEMKQPFGVAANSEHILVVDSGNSRINVYNKKGVFVSCIESKSSPLDQPRGMVLLDDCHLCVSDRDNHCIKIYKFK